MHATVRLVEIDTLNIVVMTSPRTRTRLAILVLTTLLAACARPTTRPYPVSSEPSSYSPVARLWVRAAGDESRPVVRIDSGFVLAPGPETPNPPVVMRRLFIQPFLAVSDTTLRADSAAGDGREQRGTWRVLVMGDSVPLVDSLRFGEQHRLRPLATRLRPPASPVPENAWLGFRITGDAVSVEAALADAPRQRETSLFTGGVRVFVCSPVDLRGRVDSARAAQLALAYNAAC